MNAQSTVLRLHVEHDLVWCAKGSDLPKPAHADVDAFIASHCYEEVSSVRLIGCFQNAELITKLYGHVPIELVTPLVCPKDSQRESAVTALYYMERTALAPSQGGFHVMEEHERIPYAIAAIMQRHSNNEQLIIKLARQHPAWHAMMFPYSLNEYALAALMGIILDPRWYIDTRYPDRAAKLINFLGLTPKTQAGVSIEGMPPWRRHEYCRLVRTVWYSDQTAKAVLHGRGWFDKQQPQLCSDTFGTSPRDFLWRVWLSRHNVIAGPTSESQVSADLVTSQRLIAFIRLVWLAAIYEHSKSVPEAGASLFRATDFFTYLVEAEAFNNYMLGS